MIWYKVIFTVNRKYNINIIILNHPVTILFNCMVIRGVFDTDNSDNDKLKWFEPK